jgi:hypothetical protein
LATNAYKILVGKPLGKSPLEGSRRLEGNIKKDLRKAQERDGKITLIWILEKQVMIR